MAREKSITMSVQLGVIDFAGRTICEDMAGNAAQRVTVPKWARSIKRGSACMTGDGAALGSSVGFVIIEDAPYGPHELPVGGTGAEDIDAKHDGVAASVFPYLGIPVIGGQDITVSGQMAGEDSGDIVVTLEMVFSDELPTPALKWVGCEVQPTDDNVDIQTYDLRGVQDTIKAQGPYGQDRGLIAAVIMAVGCDLAALGSGGHAVWKLSEDGVLDNQELIAGGYGGENVTAAGDTTPAVYRETHILCDIGTDIMSEVWITGEDPGTMAFGGALAFVVEGGAQRAGPRAGMGRQR